MKSSRTLVVSIKNSLDTLDHDLELILGDVLDGYVTLHGARDDYGVVIDSNSLTIDSKATRCLREQRRTQSF